MAAAIAQTQTGLAARAPEVRVVISAIPLDHARRPWFAEIRQ
jgi:hypothetical protein